MNNHEILLEFVLTTAHTEPVERRIRIYRGLAAICGDPLEEQRLLALAWDLEKADDSCRRFKFNFVQKP